jgi:hypothetical protein
LRGRRLCRLWRRLRHRLLLFNRWLQRLLSERGIVREAEKAMGKSEEFVDSMHVLEYTMRHFYTRALLLKQINGKPEQIDADLKEAAAIAEMIVPYRHARLSAVKLAGDPNNPARFNDNATADELRAEIMKRLAVLTSAGLVDLQALPAPKGGIANQPVPGSD